MTRKPLINAVLALIYIVIVAGVLWTGTILKAGANSFVAPVAMLSLFTFSAAVMGYIFFYQPFVLYFEGKKKAGVDLFLQTLFIFGGITIAILAILFLTGSK